MMMYERRRGQRNGRDVAWWGIVVLVLSVFSGGVRGAESSSAELAGLIYTGQFERANRTLSTQPSEVVTQPSDPLLVQLGSSVKIVAQREEIRVENHERYLRDAKAYLAKAEGLTPATKTSTHPADTASQPTSRSAHSRFDAAGGKKEPAPAADSPKTHIEKALTAVRKARYYAADPKQFGQQDLVRRIVAAAKVQAQEYLDRHEWLRAGNIYAELATLYEEEKSYDKLTRECAMRVRFEAVYKPKTDWNDQIKNIRIDVIPELSYNIANYYVEKPDFGKMITAGLRSVAMITEIPKLTKAFPSLTESEKTRAFDRELAKLREQTQTDQGQRTLTTKDFYQAFIKLLVINEDTVNLPQEVIIKEFTDAALGELDPFTNLIWPSEMDDFDKHTTGRFSGVGIQLSMENNKLKVITPIPGTPAYHAGIVPGDIIVTIDGESTDGITIDQAVRKITGPKGTKVTLGILHPWTESVRAIPMVRDTIIIQTVKGYRMDRDNVWQYRLDPPNDDLAYLRITSFTETTVSELKEALRAIRKQGVRGLILDLRFNPGGTLKAAYETADLFISRGVIVSTKGRNVESWTQSANPGKKHTDLPLVVLINGFSASAAEIVSGALKDYHRAWLIGERSFGKGSVQNVLPLVNESARLKMTTAYYYLPKGKCIHRKPDSKEWGVDPDLKIELTPLELRDVVDLQRDAEIVTQVNGMNVSSLPTTEKAKHPASAPAPPDGGPEGEEDELSPTTRKYEPKDVHLEAAATILRARLALKVPWKTVSENSAPSPAPAVVATSRP